MSKRFSRKVALLVAVLTARVTLAFAAPPRYEEPPILYRQTQPRDAVAALWARVESGQVKLPYDSRRGHLPALLQALQIPVTSQVLVFSKTSVQHSLITPQSPRAIYFNDNVYVGWVRGGDVIEIAAVDPSLGAVFYTLSQSAGAAPVLRRQTDACLQCHDSAVMTGGEPGFMMRSVVTDENGLPDLAAGTSVTTPQSPLSERWGGWYVTGTAGRQPHQGNRIAGTTIKDLRAVVPLDSYVTSTSDVVALMVLAHQLQVHNAVTAAQHETRLAVRDDDVINRALYRDLSTRSPSRQRRIESAVDSLVRAILFVGETKLTDAVVGGSGFAEAFSARGPRDRKGRSLREFDLKTRLFKYPCSFLVYDSSIDALPKEARDLFWSRLLRVLDGKDPDPELARMAPESRRAVREILCETRAGLPSEWLTKR